jgi:YidC/Oxa1 family membrane protein insertase
MSESRNLILAVVLSMLILGGWYYFVDLPRIQQAEQQRAATAASPTKSLASLVADAPKGVLPRSEALTQEKRVKIVSDFLHGSINLKGARFDDLTLVKFKETIAPESTEVALLSPSRTEGVYFAEFGWLAAQDGVVVPTPETVWQAGRSKLTPKEPVTLTWQSPQGLLFTIKIALDEHYMFAIEQSVQNLSGKASALLPYGLINRGHVSEEDMAISHIGPVAVLGGTLQEITYGDLIDEKRTGFEKTTGWFGISDKYWLTAVIPSGGRAFDAAFHYAPMDDKPRFQADYTGEAKELAAGEKWSVTTHFFAGAKKVGLLDQYAKDLQIPFFDRAVDFGWLYFMTKPIFKALQLFYRFFDNFGIAILALTVVVKLLLFPLANKSYRSMNQMKELHPEITRLREEYKNDKMRMNQEIMDFYKRKKINPMAGCLPILVQIPIFFALYKVLYITIEMRHAPFYGWIHDLSAPDPTSLFNLFGLLPYQVPAMLQIGVWPILMGITMLIQQLINPPPADPVQAKVMKLLPFVFVVMLASFPAGLVIYWTWSNILSILQQRLLAGGLKKNQSKGKV